MMCIVKSLQEVEPNKQPSEVGVDKVKPPPDCISGSTGEADEEAIEFVEVVPPTKQVVSQSATVIDDADSGEEEG
jgi:hypothetical protein